MAQFRAKKLDLSCFINIRVIRDHTKRKVFEQYETQRQALRYIIRNTTLPPRARAQAQLQLSQMHAYTSYAINEKDQIRSIKNPDQEFNFFISKNERMNVVQREAFNTCIRSNIQSRVLASSMKLTNLPLGTPIIKHHVPIYTSTNISTCSRLIVYIGESWQDLGVFAWRTIGQETIAAGSVLDFIHTIQSQSSDNPGILIANTGQLLWYRGGQRAVTQTTWMALPRQWAVSPPMEIDEERNRVVGNQDAKEHVAHIFDEVIPKMCKTDVAIDIIGMGDGGPTIAEYLQENWEKKWEGRVRCVAVGSGAIWLGEKIEGDGKFHRFWADRARAYIQSDEPLDTPLTGREDFGCNCYSAGQNEVLELVVPAAYTGMLKFFQLVHDVPGYRELPEMTTGVDAADVEEAA
ncbi:MAG: hypothetical protein L6R40_000965 [Gallowayella cf. fulva]|nr:MAG: hypothetical protein L6R40_000965 [Xanthomendoza cf. fulva]